MKKILCYVALVVVLVTINCTKEDQLLIPTRQDNQIDQRSVHFTLTHCPESDCRRVIPLENKQIDLYLSKQDFIQQKTPVHTIQTNEDGIANWSFLEFDSLYFAIHADLDRPENIPNDIVYTQNGTTSYVDLSYNPSCVYDFYGEKECDYNIDFQDPIVGQVSRYTFWTANGYGTDNPTELEYTGDILEVELVDIDENGYLVIEESLILHEEFDSSRFIGVNTYDLHRMYSLHIEVNPKFIDSVVTFPNDIHMLNQVSFLHHNYFWHNWWLPLSNDVLWSNKFKNTEFNGWIPQDWLKGNHYLETSNLEINNQLYADLKVQTLNFNDLSNTGTTKVYDKNNIYRTYKYFDQGLVNGYDLIPN